MTAAIPLRALDPMMRTRIWVGTALALVAGAILVGDQWLGPWFPCLLVCLVLLGVLAGRELVFLFPAAHRPSTSLTVGGVLLVLLSNWYPVVQRETALGLPAAGSAWVPVLFAFVAVALAAFVVEVYSFRVPGTAVPRLALTVLAVTYLGLLPSFLVRERWLHPDAGRSSLFLTLTVFVPKVGDVGAFFAGTFFGRTKMTPALSPKKTWEGAAGGLAFAVLLAVGLSFVGPALPGGIPGAAAFGLALFTAGVMGDLAESLIKRDCQTKDASRSIPGFGGLLDVIDSVLFAAPVAYIWFRM